MLSKSRRLSFSLLKATKIAIGLKSLGAPGLSEQIDTYQNWDQAQEYKHEWPNKGHDIYRFCRRC